MKNSLDSCSLIWSSHNIFLCKFTHTSGRRSVYSSTNDADCYHSFLADSTRRVRGCANQFILNHSLDIAYIQFNREPGSQGAFLLSEKPNSLKNNGQISNDCYGQNYGIYLKMGCSCDSRDDATDFVRICFEETFTSVSLIVTKLQRCRLSLREEEWAIGSVRKSSRD